MTPYAARHTPWHHSGHYAGSGQGYDPVATTNPTTFSYDLWFCTSSATGGMLVELGDVTTGASTIHDRVLYLQNAGKLTFGIYTGAIVNITSTASYNDGAWHHAGVTFGAVNGARLYVDGALVASNASPGSPANITGYWRWGGEDLTSAPARPTSDYVNGDVDEIAIYPTELSAQQVAWHAHANH